MKWLASPRACEWAGMHHRYPTTALTVPPEHIDIINTQPTSTTFKSDAVMDDHEDLSSLENDADEFDRLLIQNARDERRLKEALNGTRRVTAFSKARAAKHVGLTLDNLERNNARNEPGPNAVKFESPPSSSGSARSDPAIHAPPTWGRKSRANRGWMRSITYEEQEQVQAQTPPPVEETINRLYEDQHEVDDDANLPRHSVEDSPLSHKGTPRHDRSDEWDLTFELNEASMIASTPYIPRNTALDDIRNRENESAKMDRLRQGSPEETRRPRTAVTANGAISAEQAMQVSASSEKRRSWQSIGKSQPVTGSGKENLPVAIYKTTTESVSVVEGDVNAASQKRPVRPLRHRREDSQDLLRRLARASNTPSPGRVAAASRPHTAPARQPDSQPVQTDTPPDTPDKILPVKEQEPVPAPKNNLEDIQDVPRREAEMPPAAANPPEGDAEDVDATPMPVERSILAPKTPVVTGAWVDTPGPRTARKQLTIARSPAHSPKKASPQKRASPEKKAPRAVQEAPEETDAEVIRPQVSRSALQALVQEAKTQESADYGDSTISSLEELITTPTGEVEEDTLQGLQLPTVTPRNEAERQRQQELLHLHRMNDRLRAARTSIRDASRGMKRVEDRVEHGEEVEGATVLACPCAAAGHIPLWKYPFKVFWDSKLKSERSGSRTRMLGGLTLFSILLLSLLAWWISEEFACEFYCHHPYATYSPHRFSVDANAPQYPFVLPTLFYRTFVRAWWEPSSLVTRWVWRNTLGEGSPTMSASGAASWQASQSRSVVEEAVWEQSMMHDEVVR